MEPEENSSMQSVNSKQKKIPLMNFIVDMCDHHRDNSWYDSQGCVHHMCDCSICKGDLIKWIDDHPHNPMFEFKCLDKTKFRNEPEDAALFLAYDFYVATAETATLDQLKGNFKAAVKKNCPKKLIPIKKVPEELHKRVKRYQFVTRPNPIAPSGSTSGQNGSSQFDETTMGSTHLFAYGNALLPLLNSYLTSSLTTLASESTQTCFAQGPRTSADPVQQVSVQPNGLNCTRATGQVNTGVNGYNYHAGSNHAAHFGQNLQQEPTLSNGIVNGNCNQTNFGIVPSENYPHVNGTMMEYSEPAGGPILNGSGQTIPVPPLNFVNGYHQNEATNSSGSSQIPVPNQTMRDYQNLQRTEDARQSSQNKIVSGTEVGVGHVTTEVSTDQPANEEPDYQLPDTPYITGEKPDGIKTSTSEEQCNPSKSQTVREIPSENNPVTEPEAVTIYPCPNRPVVASETLSRENRRNLQMVKDYDLARLLMNPEAEVRKIEFNVFAKRGDTKVQKNVIYREVSGDYGGFKILPGPLIDGGILDTSKEKFGPSSITDGGIRRELMEIPLHFDNCRNDSNVNIQKALETFESGALVFWWEQYQVDMQVAQDLGTSPEVIQPLFSRLYCRRRCRGYRDKTSDKNRLAVMPMCYLSPFEEQPKPMEEFEKPEDVLVLDLFQTLLKTLEPLRALGRTPNTPAYEGLQKKACLHIGVKYKENANSKSLHMRFEVRSCLLDKMLQEVAGRRNIIDDTASVVTETTAEFAELNLD